MANAYPERPINAVELKKDAASVVQQLHDAWGGEVEILVVLVPKGSTQAATARSIRSNEQTRTILTNLLHNLPLVGNLRTKLQ